MKSKLFAFGVNLKESFQLFFPIATIAVVSCLLSFPTLSQAQTKNPPKSSGEAHLKYMGVASCSSSNCHGSVAPRDAVNVLQNEYTTWSKHDAHSRSWLSLTNEDSKRIGFHLGIDHPEKEPLCLKCHATYVSNADLENEKYRLEDGVSCESCHGAAEKYLAPHTEANASHARNLELGMRDIVGPDKRSQLCLGCHYGSEDQTVNHRLIGAGHPRLTFELDTFSALEPAHWDIDDDYLKRKEAYSSTRTWLVGQIDRGIAMLQAMQSSTRSRSNEGLLAGPELTLLYCYTCHHSLTEGQWKERDYAGKPGELRLNVSSMLIAEQALKALNYNEVGSLGTKVVSLHTSSNTGKAASELVATLEKAKQFVLSTEYDKARSQKLLRSMVEYGAANKDLPFEVAEQIAMATSSIVASQSKDGSLYKREIDQMYGALSKPEEFRPQLFTSACNLLLQKLA